MSNSWTDVHKHVQWTIQVAPDGSYQVVNLGPNGERQFYLVRSGKYGEPLLVQEPDLAVAPPKNVAYQDGLGQAITAPAERISGFICKDGTRVIIRTSLSKARRSNVAWSLTEDGTLEIDGKKFYLVALVRPDKDRMIETVVGFFSVQPNSDPVRVIELEDAI